MQKVFQILKKYLFVILIIISLVAIQAICELSLPSYTSDIVNVGIQQSGIESINLEYISEGTYDKLLSFMNTNEKEYFTSKYTLGKKDDLKDKYYRLKEINDSEKEKLENILIKPETIIYALDNKMIDIKTFGFETVNEFYEYLKVMPEAEKEKMLDSIKLDESGLTYQIGLTMVKDEYNTLGVNVNKMQIDYIKNTGLKMLGIALITAIVTIISSFLSSRVAAYFAKDLRNNITKKVMTYSHKEFEEIKTASLITRTTNDVTQVQNLLMMSLRMLIFAPIMGIGAIIKVWGSSLSWIIIAIVVFIIALVIIIFAFVTPKFKIVQKLIDKLNLISREFITGIPVIRAFSNEKYQEKKFNKVNKDITKLSLFLNKVTSLMMPIMNLTMNFACILILWFGAKRIDFGTIQVGDLIALITYSMHIIMSFLIISMFSIMLPRALVSLKRISEILEKDTSIKDKEEVLPFNDALKGTVEFKNVTFKYADAEENVLENISFKATPGSTVAFIGSTGSGKSTLIKLIPRFSDVTSGEILVDGVNIKDASLKDLRENIGYVPQKGILFTGTIGENIKLAKDEASIEDVELAMKISCSTEFIKEKEEGLDTLISEGGTNVSGGQRQRLAIARAVIKNPEIFIFDDSFSALDYKTDANVRKLLDKYTKNSTKLIVAQRINTIMNADEIIVLDEGKIVDKGTHKELMERCLIYQEIAKSQIKEVA